MRPEDNPQDWHQQKTYESMMSYGLNAIKFVLVANGGAILSILTFLGNHPERISCIKPALILFVAGVVFGGLVNLTAYLTQLSLFNQRTDKVKKLYDHMTWLILSMSFIFLGTVCFAVGAFKAILALQ